MKTGNNKVAALDKVLGICNVLGSNYNPSEASLQPAALKALLELAREKQEAVNVTRAAHLMALNARKDGFVGIPTLAARVARLVNVSKPKPSDREEVRLIKRRLYPVKSKKSTDVNTTVTSEAQVSKATGGRPKRDKPYVLETFKQLIQVVDRIPGYNPNEMEFKVAGLKSKQVELHACLDAVNVTSIAYQEALIAYHELIYSPGGVNESTKLAMDYIRGKFGFTSIRTKKVTQQTSHV